jgi:hypothetical protein
MISARSLGNQHALGYRHTEETRQQFRVSMTDLARLRAVSDGLKEKWRDPEWRAKMLVVLRQNNERKRLRE